MQSSFKKLSDGLSAHGHGQLSLRLDLSTNCWRCKTLSEMTCMNKLPQQNIAKCKCILHICSWTSHRCGTMLLQAIPPSNSKEAAPCCGPEMPAGLTFTVIALRCLPIISGFMASWNYLRLAEFLERISSEQPSQNSH